jgi:hypothetical protein
MAGIGKARRRRLFSPWRYPKFFSVIAHDQARWSSLLSGKLGDETLYCGDE